MPAAWSQALAALVVAGAEHAAGAREAAAHAYARAEERLRGADLGFHARAAQWVRGALVGGGTGRALRDEAEEWLREQGVVDPAALVRVVAPS